MFTGIIEEVGHVTAIVDKGGTRRLIVSATEIVKQLKRGDSIAVSGVCLTAVEITPQSFSADLRRGPTDASTDTSSRDTWTAPVRSFRLTEYSSPMITGFVLKSRPNWHAT